MVFELMKIIVVLQQRKLVIMKTQNEMISETYDYNRRMNDRLVDVLNSNFQWLIDYVKSKEELDFLTRKDDFSVYRGTSSILNIQLVGGNKKNRKVIKING